MRLSRLPLQSPFLLALLIALASCTGEVEPDPGAEYYLRADIDGTPFEALGAVAVKLDTGIMTALGISGGDVLFRSFDFRISMYDSVGSCVLGDDFGSAGVLLSGQFYVASTDLGEDGVMDVELDDGEVIEGTFSFVLENTDTGFLLPVTEGKFRLRQL